MNLNKLNFLNSLCSLSHQKQLSSASSFPKTLKRPIGGSCLSNYNLLLPLFLINYSTALIEKYSSFSVRNLYMNPENCKVQLIFNSRNQGNTYRSGSLGSWLRQGSTIILYGNNYEVGSISCHSGFNILTRTCNYYVRQRIHPWVLSEAYWWQFVGLVLMAGDAGVVISMGIAEFWKG